MSAGLWDGESGLTVTMHTGPSTADGTDRRRIQISAVTPEGERTHVILTRAQWVELRRVMASVYPYAPRLS